MRVCLITSHFSLIKFNTRHSHFIIQYVFFYLELSTKTMCSFYLRKHPQPPTPRLPLCFYCRFGVFSLNAENLFLDAAICTLPVKDFNLHNTHLCFLWGGVRSLHTPINFIREDRANTVIFLSSLYTYQCVFFLWGGGIIVQGVNIALSMYF